jgi:hypothetical protein
MQTQINWDRVDYIQLILALMSLTDSRLNNHADDRLITDIIDSMGPDTAMAHELENDHYFLGV